MPQPLMPKELKLTGSMKNQYLQELTPKRCPFHHRGLECKSRSQEIPGKISKFGLGVQNEAGQRLTVFSREHVHHSKRPFITTQEMTLHMNITRWSTPKSDWLCSLQPKMKKLYKQLLKTRTGSDCGSDHEFLISKFRLKLKKRWKTTSPFRYDLNQIPYDCMVEMMNRFKGLCLVDRMSEELWMEVCDIIKEVVSKSSPRKRNVKRQNGCLRRPYK